MSWLLIDVADLAGYAEPGTAEMDLDTLHIARRYAAKLLAVAKLNAPGSSGTVGKSPAIIGWSVCDGNYGLFSFITNSIKRNNRLMPFIAVASIRNPAFSML